MQRLERKLGGERRKGLLQQDDIDKFKAIRPGNAGDLEQFAELLDVVVVGLVEKKCFAELGSGYLYRTLQTKMNEQLLNHYKRWLREYQNPSTVESLRLFVMEESEDQVATMETFRGISAARKDLSDRGVRAKGGHQHALLTSATPAGTWASTQHGAQGGRGGPGGQKYQLDCRMCGANHGLWKCPAFIALDYDQRWAKAKDTGVCFKCLSRTQHGDKCTRA